MRNDFDISPEFYEWLRAKGSLDVSEFVEELDRARKTGLIDRSFDRYDDATTIALWREYKNRSMRDPNSDAVPFAFREQIEQTAQILQRDPSCQKVVNFGALYAFADAKVAEQFSAVEFYAIDRSAEVGKLNETEFPASNIHFIASDIFAFIESTDLSGALLVHNRTAMFLYPAAVEKLYAMARANGVKHILALEWTGYSHELEQLYCFTDKPQESAVLRNGFYVHDYPNMLRAAGYSNVGYQIKKLPMVKPHQLDAHLIVVTASN